MPIPPRTPSRRHARSRRDLLTRPTVVAGPGVRLLALVGVGAFGVAALSATSSPPPVSHLATSSVTTAATSADAPAGHPLASVVPVRPVAAHAHATAPEAHSAPAPAAKPASTASQPASAPARKPDPRPGPAAHPAPPAPQPAAKWTPSGTGMWIYQWDHTEGGNAARVVQRAKAVGLSTLYLRTGSSWDGLDNVGALHSLLAAADGTDLHVVAWDFPRLWHPVQDARRLASVARLHDLAGDRVSAVAPDIETPNEGTYNAAWRVALYLKTLRRALPDNVAILTALPWPSSYRIQDYPYRTVARGSDVLIPMAYWYDNPPALVAARSMDYLRQFGKPVEPVGQGYDGSEDVHGIHNNLKQQVPVFLRTAKAHGAKAVSLWSWQAAPQPAWKALSRARGMFSAPPPAH